MVLPMKKNRMRRIFIFILIAAILLTMQGFPVLAEKAETEQQEKESETEGLEQEKESETEGLEQEKESETEEQEPEEEPETEEQEPEAEEPEPEEPEAEEPEPEEPEAEESEPEEPEIVALAQSENPIETTMAQSAADANLLKPTGVPDDILAECIVPGLNPPGVIVNLFDYWQDNPEEAGKEVPHDYYYKYWDYDNSKWVEDVLAATYDLGISRGHLLRFGYTNTDNCPACAKFGQRGEWNIYRLQTPYPGIVKTGLGADGFPVLNLAGKSAGDYQQYAASIDSYQTEESLAYLFSPYVDNAYKKSYSNVQGLFQKREDGSYYYSSTLNFASYDGAGSFILYNSPGVAEESNSTTKFRGQFFPFNSAKDVFNNYTDEGNGNYRLDYLYFYEQPDENAPNYSDYNSISDGTNGYMQCYAPDLNHYLGMTMEMQFLQPEGGYLSSDASTPMTFKFSGDDDVWIFIDDVLVADLGGLHDACSLKIDFSTGVVDVQGAGHTLLDSFQSAYGNDANPGGIAFRDNTFADNTVHTLKMFYLERGHMASNLSLDFNIQTLTNGQIVKEEEDESNSEEDEPYYEEDEPYYEEENTDENEVVTVESILPAVNNEMPESIDIPKTGDDSLIGWWAALSIISLLGIGATVCNLILTGKKQKK